MSNSSLTIRPSALPSLSPARTVLLAVAIEALLLLAAGSLIAQARTASPQAADQAIELAIEEPKPVAPKEEPKPVPKPVERPVPVKRSPTPPLPAPPVAPPVPTVADPVAESPVSEPVAPPAPPPPPMPSNDAAAKEADFAAKLRAAIQAAVAYPYAARAMGSHGKARVEFAFRDGVSSHVRIVQGSGNGLLDQAALAAVANAAVPPLPDSLKGKNMTYQVTVVFELNGSR